MLYSIKQITNRGQHISRVAANCCSIYSLPKLSMAVATMPFASYLSRLCSQWPYQLTESAMTHSLEHRGTFGVCTIGDGTGSAASHQPCFGSVSLQQNQVSARVSFEKNSQQVVALQHNNPVDKDLKMREMPRLGLSHHPYVHIRGGKISEKQGLGSLAFPSV